MYNLGYNKSFENSVTSDTYKVMIVRHPLDRIVSAYKYIFQELAGMGFETFCLQNESSVQFSAKDETKSNLYSNLSRLIVQNYRPNASSDEILTFPEFVRFLVNGTKENLKGE